MRFYRRRVVCCAPAQVFIYAIRRDDFARIHSPFRVPDGFELAEGFDHFVAEHFGQQFGARLPVAVLARKRPAVADHKIGGFFQKCAPLLNAVGGLQIERQPGVQTAVAEMAVERADIIVFVHQLFELAQISAELIGRHGRIFPAFVVVRFARDARGRAQPLFAKMPDDSLLLRVVEEPH